MKRVLLPLIFVAAAAAVYAGPDLTSARIYRNQGDLGKAISFFNLEIEKNPEGYAAIFERGEVYGLIAMDNTKKGELRDLAGDSEDSKKEILERMLADFRTVKSVADEKAQKKLKTELKSIDRILRDYWTEFYNEAVAADTRHASALEVNDSTAAGVAEQSALRATELAILLKPEEWNPYALRGQVLDRAGRSDEANEVWAQAKTALENSALRTEDQAKYDEAWMVIQLHRMQNYYNFDNYDKTLEVADEILAVQADNSDAEVFRAFALTNMLNDSALSDTEAIPLREQALHALEAAHEATPEDAAVVFYLGQFHLDNADTAAALEWYRKYTELDTVDQEVIFHLGYLYLEGGSFKDYAKAEAVYQSMVNHFPENCDAWINLGVSQINQDRTAVGAENINKGKDCKKAKAGE